MSADGVTSTRILCAYGYNNITDAKLKDMIRRLIACQV